MRNEDERPELTQEDIYHQREIGFFWYSGLWRLVRPVLVFLAALLLAIGVIRFAYGKIADRWIHPVDPKDQTPVVFQVSSGDSLSRVASSLEQQGLVRSRTFFKYYADFLGFGQKIQSGEYTLSRAMKVNEIVEKLSEGDGRPLVRDITIIPGWTVEDIAAYLVKEKALSKPDTFLNLCRTGQGFDVYYYIKDVLSGKTARDRKYALEGYLAANTYEVYTSADETDILKKLLSQTEGMYLEMYHQRQEELGMTMDQVLTLASMIEKEAKTADFNKVSAVFHLRLKKGMALGSDVTVKYILKTKRMALTRQDLAVKSLYNTYLYKGLPPGPICNPSPDAVHAALYPNEQMMQEGYLYFCSKNPDTGELHFSKTLKEHEQAVKIYAPLWEAFDRRTNRN